MDKPEPTRLDHDPAASSMPRMRPLPGQEVADLRAQVDRLLAAERERGRTAALDATRELLAVLLEAIDTPHAADVAGAQARREALEERAMHATICLRSLLREGDRPWAERLVEETAYLRGRLAELPPLAYETWDGPKDGDA